jgi:uncharacterized protein YceK
MCKPVKLFILLLILLNTGCGTLFTRINEHPVGYPAYAATYLVAVGGFYLIPEYPPLIIPWAVSLPVDFVFDTLFLPFDIIAMTYGIDKHMPRVGGP